MYPSINTAQCISRLLEYLSSPEISNRYGFSSKALLKAPTLMMLNNCMWFGDIAVKQLSGIATGMLPAPTIANLFVAIYKTTHVLPHIPQVMLYLRCFINNGFGIWLHDPVPLINKSNWLKFQACLNESGLKWIFSKRLTEVVFMDLRLKTEAKKVVASLYAKPMAIHLYIPPHSCHCFRALCLKMCYKSTSCALALLMSPENSRSSSTASWIAGINWPSSPHSFNKQQTMPRPT
jgi:hypothetical protein